MRPPPRVRAVVTGLRGDHLLQNSFFIMLSTTTMGVLGFLFWLVSARLFPVDQIGVATTLISAANLLAYVSLLGFDTTLITSLPGSRHQGADIDSAVLLVATAATVVGFGYIVIVPAFTPELAFVRSSIPMLGGFVVLTAFTAVNLITDSAFIAYRAARYNFLIDGIVQGGTKLAAVLAVVGLGSYGLFLASGVAAMLAFLASVALLALRFSYRPRLRIRFGAVRAAYRVSAANYLANLFNILPIMALPLIVLNGRGSEDAGYFFVAFQVANLLYAVTYAVSQSLLAEGSHADTQLRGLARRSAKVQAALILPAAAGLMAIAAPLLRVFGGEYRNHAFVPLLVFAAAAPAVALHTWTTALLRLKGGLVPLVWSHALFAVVVCGLAAAWSRHGLSAVALAWLLGNLGAGLLAGAWLLTQRASPGPTAEVSEPQRDPVLVPQAEPPDP